MSVEVDVKALETAKENCKLHRLPCHIEYNGEANVDNYFDTTVREQENGQLTASFRGRPLNGQNLNIPAGYTGYVLKENHRPFSEEEERKVTVTHTFREFTYWNLDRSTSSNDKLQRAFEWLNIAKALHSPIDEENSQKSLAASQ